MLMLPRGSAQIVQTELNCQARPGGHQAIVIG